jgi:hypothetical protein
VAGAGERQREEVGDRHYSELGRRGPDFDRQWKERLTTGGALRRRVSAQGCAVVHGAEGT